jgi:lysophospholipase L1-like esterase
MLQRLFALTLALALLPGSANLSARELKIVAFGDSTTAVRNTIEKVYADRLAELLAPLGVRAEVINAGVGGSNTSAQGRHALARLGSVREQQADWVIVQFGINDCWVDQGEEDGPSRVSREDYRRNLTAIVHTLRQDGSRVLLMTPNQLHSETPAWRADRLAAYAEVVRGIARDWRVPLADVWNAYAELTPQERDALLLDTAHPGDRGQALVAELIADRLKPLLAAAVPAAEAAKPVEVSRSYSIPTLDLTEDSARQVIVDREAGQYLGHPTTALLEDGRTILTVYPKGHGRGAIVMKRSDDGGLTWSERLPVPENWATSREVPTLYRVYDADGKRRLIMFSGLYPIRMAVSEDDGATWTPLDPIGDYGGIVAMGCLFPIKTGPGHFMTLFHDDGRFFTKDGTKSPNFKLFKTVSTDGGLTWGAPEEIYESGEVHLCEPGVIRSPDGTQLAILLRENRRRQNSHVIFSDDEGTTWTEPREVPAALTGDRHTAVYGPDGRLFVSFRDTTLDSPTKGDWVAWVGTYEDIARGREGQYRVRLKQNHKGADCAYPGVEILPDGTIVTTTYGHWTPGEAPYILSVRLKLDELDALSIRSK